MSMTIISRTKYKHAFYDKGFGLTCKIVPVQHSPYRTAVIVVLYGNHRTRLVMYLISAPKHVEITK